MPRSNKCGVKGCVNDHKEASSSRSLHTLPPKDQKKVRRRWLQVLKITHLPINKTVLVCSFHFRKTDFFPRKFL